MAPQMAAFMASSAVVFMFLLVCPVFSYIPAISFTRDELLDIWKYTPPDQRGNHVAAGHAFTSMKGGVQM